MADPGRSGARGTGTPPFSPQPHGGMAVDERWVSVILTNLGLGFLAVVPVWLLSYLMRHTLLAWWALSEPNPTENDGALPLMLLIVPVLLVFAAMWWALNFQARRCRRTGMWAVAVLSTLLPSALLLLVSSIKR